MSEKEPPTRKINPMFGLLAFVIAFGALVLVVNQPANAVTFTSINNLVGAVTLAHFTSLNLTTSGNTLTLGINLAHSNTWTSLQTFAGEIATDTVSFPSTSASWELVGACPPGCGSTGLMERPMSANGYGQLAIAPTGSGTYAVFELFASSDLTTNYQYLRMCDGCVNPPGTFVIDSEKGGTASLLPIAFNVGSTTILKLSNTGIGNTQGYQSIIAQTLSAGTSTTVNLPVTEPDTSYGVVCSLVATTPLALSVSGQTTTQFVINYPSILSAEAADCIIWHQ